VANCYVAKCHVASCVVANCVVASCYVANCMGILLNIDIFDRFFKKLRLTRTAKRVRYLPVPGTGTY
jgi:hypothetical protein